MKKLLSFALIISLLSGILLAMPMATHAVDLPGDWTTYRAAAEYPLPDEDTTGKVYKPEAGYKYTEEGFVVVPADYTDSTPFMTVQTKEPQPIQDGVYMEFRVDDYCYSGPEHNIDSWICISITNKPKVTPGAPAYGGGWMCLIRGNGGGAEAKVESCNTVENSSFKIMGDTKITPNLDSDGRELYTFEATYNGFMYNFKLNGVALAGMPEISGNLKNMDPNGEFYVGVTLYSSMKDGQAAMSILKYGTDKAHAYVPTGTDSKEPEPNLIKVADISDPSTVPENKPALYWDASVIDPPNGTNLTLDALGDNAYRVTMTETLGFFSWNMSRSVSYSGTDFPVFAALLRNYRGDGGSMWYYGGKVLGAEGNNRIDWSSYEGPYYEHEEDDYILVEVDLSELWEGRINGLRIDFAVPENAMEFDICYMGFFRSIEEAEAYCEERLIEKGVDIEPKETEPETSVPEETEPQEIEPQETEAPTEAPTEAETKAEVTTAPAVTDAPQTEQGCASVAGVSAVSVLMLTVAAYFGMKKKED
ncbi:MAG: hypothetical protein E7645_03090 [Ruminococcaceae bacterium]|nr:hypothetical protein [Oscillospiraceae bacterium]